MNPSFRRRARRQSLGSRLLGELSLGMGNGDLLTIGEEYEWKGSFAVAKAVTPSVVLELRGQILSMLGRNG